MTTVPEAIAAGHVTADEVVAAEVVDLTTGPQWFRKLPVAIQAWQLTEDADWEAIADWCGGRLLNVEQGDSGEYETYLEIDTLEGTMRAGLGDWVLRGVQGEFYPCRADIFEASYESTPPPQHADEPAVRGKSAAAGPQRGG